VYGQIALGYISVPVNVDIIQSIYYRIGLED